MQTRVFHIYHDMQRADDVVDRLLASGIGRKHISILTTEAAGAKHLAMTEGTKAEESGNIRAAIGGAVGLIGVEVTESDRDSVRQIMSTKKQSLSIATDV